MNENLTQAARSALAELIAVHYEGGLTATGRRTVVDLHDALQATGENLVDYEEDYANVVNSSVAWERHSQSLSAS